MMSMQSSSGGTEWAVAQFEALAENIRTFDRFMWQVPVGTLAAIGLLLNAAVENRAAATLGRVATVYPILLSAALALYATFLLARFHVRREIRERMLKELEHRMGSFSIVVGSAVVNEDVAKRDRFDRCFASIDTTRLGCYLLLLSCVVLLATAVLLTYL